MKHVLYFMDVCWCYRGAFENKAKGFFSLSLILILNIGSFLVIDVPKQYAVICRTYGKEAPRSGEPSDVGNGQPIQSFSLEYFPRLYRFGRNDVMSKN